ncbi:MAG: hypothetical protein ACM3ZF_14765 [Mycobacterium leprae]
MGDELKNVDALLAWATTHIACEWCGVQGATYDDSLDVFLCPNRHVAIKAFVKKYGLPAKVNDYPEDD